MTGLVSLVGAGPGDPELITVKGLDRLRHCDVVVFDRLIDVRLLGETRPDAERVFVGKAPGVVVLSQRGIEQVLIGRARQGKRVVRLKGGDPFVFGRGGEEIEALAAAGIEWEVVPGVTSAVAAASAAGIPLTHRDLSSTVMVVTGHEDPAKPDSAVDWSWVARSNGTIVVLMGLERLDRICRTLVTHGLDPETRGAVVSNATNANQRSVFAPIASLARAVASADLTGPAAIVFGEVTRFPEMVAELANAEFAEAV
ncbi:MAG TPA: uroporphyrinogen-III C-methyltransferase [Chloroflexota bacterium]|jgi:uroporphyrin-III C-methyltransferase|nr:uroporphyrinogen-III C-methyltransferase [Chloroflexota bacterium]